MNTQIISKDLKITDARRTHVENAFEAFAKFQLELTACKAILRNEKKGVGVEFEIMVAHHSPVIINQSADDVDEAIDIAIERASKALRRLHTRAAGHGNHSIKNMQLIEDELLEEA